MPHQWTVLEAKMMRGHGIGINDLVFTVDDKNGTGRARQDCFGFVIGTPQRLLCLFALGDILEDAAMKGSVLAVGGDCISHRILHLRILPLRIAVGQQPLNVRGCNDCASERSEAGGADTVKSKELRGRLASGADGWLSSLMFQSYQ